jgi:cytochrome P450
MTQSHVTLPHVDPYSDAFQQQPAPAYASLRAAAPVYQVPGRDLYLVSSMALVREVLQDPATYANSVTTMRRPQPPPAVADEVERIRASGFAYQSALGLSDPPRHTRYRKLVGRAFMPRSLAWMEPLVADASRELVAALPAGGTVDIVPALARPLPVWAISKILGLPDAWRDDVARWSEAATASVGSRPIPADLVLQHERDMIDYQEKIVLELDRRRAEPGEDLLSVLVQPDPEEGALSNAELVWLIRELIVAGNETTTKLITDLVLRLSDLPHEWRRLRDEPARAAVVVEEGLRLASPAQGMFRRVTRPIVLGGVHLPADATLFLAYGSANRDETVFAEPNEFDPDRHNVRQHVSFGQGIHACLGNVLARMEAATVLRELVQRLDGLEVVEPAAVTYTPSFWLRGILELPVVVHARRD